MWGCVGLRDGLVRDGAESEAVLLDGMCSPGEADSSNAEPGLVRGWWDYATDAFIYFTIAAVAFALLAAIFGLNDPVPGGN